MLSFTDGMRHYRGYSEKRGCKVYKAFCLDGFKFNIYKKIYSSMNWWEPFKKCNETGKKNLNTNTELIDSYLNDLKDSKGIIDGSKLSNDWFPQIQADVFISHSHKDLNTALNLAGMLETIGLTPFIDSCIWGYADNLQKAIDIQYCKNDNSNYFDYQKRNYSTSHVHMMLTIALSKMIYNTECLIFLKTTKSVYPKDDIPEKNKMATLSPWIYTELEMTNLIEKRTLETHRKKRIIVEAETEPKLKIKHSDKFRNIAPLSANNLFMWLKNVSENKLPKHKALDMLYSNI